MTDIGAQKKNKWVVTDNVSQWKLLRGFVLSISFSGSAELPSRLVWQEVRPELLEHGKGAKGLGLYLCSKQGEAKKEIWQQHSERELTRGCGDHCSVPEAGGGEFRKEYMLVLAEIYQKDDCDILKK